MGLSPVAYRITLVLATLWLAGHAAFADAADDRRALVLLRTLAYDDHLEDRVGDEVRVVILYAGSDAGTADGKRWTQAFANVRKLKVAGKPVTVRAVRYEGAKPLAGALDHAAAVVACDGLREALAVSELARLTRAGHVLSFTTRERDVVDGLAIGLVRGDARDEIVVNLGAAAAEGAKLDAGLLQLARRVGGQR